MPGMSLAMLPTAGSVVLDHRDEPDVWHGRIELDNLVATRLGSRAAAMAVFHFAKQPVVAMTRGVLAIVGVFFAFASILSFTPPWTGFIYLLGLAPEVIFTVLLTDLMAVRRLMIEFEFLVIVLSMMVFAALIAQSLDDARAVVPVTIAVVVTSSQLSDVSMPYFNSSRTDGVFALVGAFACLALYVLFQFGWVTGLTQITYSFSVGGIHAVTWSNVQFACDRLLTAVFFLTKQAVAVWTRPGTFVAIKAEIRKRVEEVV